MTEKNKEEMKESKEIAATKEQVEDSKEVTETSEQAEVKQEKDEEVVATSEVAETVEDPKDKQAEERNERAAVPASRSDKADGKWSKFTSNKWYIGLAALALIGAGGVVGASVTGAYVYTHQHKAAAFMDEVRERFSDDANNANERSTQSYPRKQNDRYDNAADQTSNQLTTKVDFKTAAETVLKEAGTGFVTSIHLDMENGKAVYEVETFDGNTEKDYTIDADSGAVLRSQTDSTLDAKDRSLPQPKKSVTDMLAAVQAKYTNAKINGISLDRERSGKWVYEVELLDGNSFKTAFFDTENGEFINEEMDRD